MDFYEPLPEFDANGIYLDFEDRQNGIDEWIEGEFTEWMSSRGLSVITDRHLLHIHSVNSPSNHSSIPFRLSSKSR